MTTIKDPLTVEGVASSTSQGVFIGTVEELPAAGQDCAGVIVYYCGDDTGELVPHSLYRCVSSDDGATWGWTLIAEALNDTVSTSLTINGHALTGDIVLTADDVGATTGTIPTKVSELANDGVYVTQDVSTLSNYFTKQQTAGILTAYCRLLVVDELPKGTAIDSACLYSVPTDDGRRLYYRADGAWVQVG